MLTRVLLLAAVLALGIGLGMLLADRSAPPPVADASALRYAEIQQDLVVIKVIKQGFFENRIEGFNQRVDMLAAEVDDMPIGHERRWALLWPLKDYVMQFQVPVSQDTYDILDQLPARQVGAEGRYAPDRPVASEVRGMQGYDRSRLRR